MLSIDEEIRIDRFQPRVRPFPYFRIQHLVMHHGTQSLQTLSRIHIFFLHPLLIQVKRDKMARLFCKLENVLKIVIRQSDIFLLVESEVSFPYGRELRENLLLDLAHAFACHPHLPCHLFQRQSRQTKFQHLGIPLPANRGEYRFQ